jgi:pentapeptide MXKDX repeat protein
VGWTSGLQSWAAQCPFYRLENAGQRNTILRAPGKSEFPLRGICPQDHSKEQPKMKKVLALMFALALTVSLSSFGFAQASGSDAKSGDKMEKSADSKDKKATTKKKATKKKDDSKKDGMKKDNMSK